MKRITDYPEYHEEKNFRLTNKQRPYFGLNPINGNWDEIVIKQGTTVFYDGEIIKKVITWENSKGYVYKEFDTELPTRDRLFILPKTSKGKEKKVTPTNVFSPLPSGCLVYISLQTPHFKSHIHVGNSINNIILPITEDEGLYTITDLQKWLENYINTCPAGYFEKVERMRTMPHRTIRYKVGDIFRFEIDREYYGFGIIIGRVRQLEKLNAFGDNHPMHDVMSVPLLIRLYKFKTKDKDLPIEKITENDLLTTDLVSDCDIIWGTHEIIGNKELEENDIDFPIQYGFTIDVRKKPKLRLAWGTGLIEIHNPQSLPKELHTSQFSNNAVSISMPIFKLIRVLNGGIDFDHFDDLRHPQNDELRYKLFKILGLSEDITIDGFNAWCDGMTRKQYIEFIKSI